MGAVNPKSAPILNGLFIMLQGGREEEEDEAERDRLRCVKNKVCGGYIADFGTVTNIVLNIAGRVSAPIYGGYVKKGDIDKIKVNIISGTEVGFVCGGQIGATGTIKSVCVNVEDGAKASDIWGGNVRQGSVIGSTVVINAQANVSDVCGGIIGRNGNIRGVYVNIAGKVESNVVGGEISEAGNVVNTRVEVVGQHAIVGSSSSKEETGKVNKICGGCVNIGTVENSTVVVTRKGKVKGNVYGGEIGICFEDDNHLGYVWGTLRAGKPKRYITSPAAAITNTAVYFSDAQIDGDVYGGEINDFVDERCCVSFFTKNSVRAIKVLIDNQTKVQGNIWGALVRNKGEPCVY
ncbi:MAG: hypothetical protein LBQ13_01615, partial [Endomicrobium sp.]|nr:hypothetical protein [Endomicrobium sp.]